MPEGTIKATADHGKLIGDTIHGTYDASRQVFADLEKLGIGYDNVVAYWRPRACRSSKRRGTNCSTRSERRWGSDR